MTGGQRQGGVVIVGAGVIGLACAHYLCKAGLKVTVLDKGEVCSGASQRNCGHILPSHIMPLNSWSNVATGLKSLFNKSSPFRVKPQPDSDLAKWMLSFLGYCRSEYVHRSATALQPLLEYSYTQLLDICEEVQGAPELEKRGLLYVFQGSDAFESFAAMDQKLADDFGISAKRISSDQLAKIEGSLRPEMSGGYFYDIDGHISPENLTRSWRTYLEEKGVEFIEYCEFEDLEVSGTRVSQLFSSAGEFQPDHVVFAMGAMSGQLTRKLNLNVPVVPGKGYTIDIKQFDNPLTQPLVIPENGVAVTPFEDRIRIGSIMEFAGFDTSLPEHRISYLLDSLQSVMAEPLSRTCLSKWYGWRPMTPDSVPIIGPIDGLKNAFLATGHQMIGLMSAPATGKLISDFILGRRPSVSADGFSPARFS